MTHPYPTNPSTGLPDIPGHFFKVSHFSKYYPECSVRLIKGKPRGKLGSWLFNRTVGDPEIIGVADARYPDLDGVYTERFYVLTAEDVKEGAEQLAEWFYATKTSRESIDALIGDYPPRSV